MPNTSHIFLLLLLLSILIFQSYTYPWPICTTVPKLPQFHKFQVQMLSMKQQKTSSSIQRSAYNYVLNYPVQLLSRSFSSNIQSILSITKFDIQSSQKTIHYRVKQIKSQTALLLTYQYYQSKYREFRITVFLYNRNSFVQLVKGQISLTSISYIYLDIQGRLSTTTSSNLPAFYKTRDDGGAKTLIFITGINIALKNIQKFQYEIQLNQKYDQAKNQIIVQVNTGQNTILSEIYLTYILFSYYQNYKVPYQTSANYANYSLIGQGTHDYLMLRDIHSSHYALFGLSSFKIKKGLGPFKLEFNLHDTAYGVLQMKTSQPISIIKVAIFRIGNRINVLCGQCKYGQSFVLNEVKSAQCVTSCPDGVALGNKCPSCPKQLNYRVSLSNFRCQCIPPNILRNGKCVPPQTQSQIFSVANMPTFSTINVQCIQPNTYKDSTGKCNCKTGYESKTMYNINQCYSKCTNGYFNGQSCVSCPAGTFAWNQLQTCLKCCQNCNICKTQFTCQQCRPGFVPDFNGQCVQVCGDGMKIYAQCDDGNLFDGDGCSSKCKIQEGYTCISDQSGKSVCSNQQYALKRKNIMFASGNLIIDYISTPPLPRYFSAQELQQNVVIVKYIQSGPKSTYIAQNQHNLSEFRIVGSYGGLAPTLPAIIDVTIRLPSTNGQYTVVFNQRITYNFISMGGRTFARNMNGAKDVIN